MKNMLPMIVKGKAAVSQAEHASGVRILACEEAGTAWRARRSSTKGLTEQYPLFSKTLDVRCWNSVTIGLDIAAGVMGVNVENIWSIQVHQNTPFRKLQLTIPLKLMPEGVSILFSITYLI